MEANTNTNLYGIWLYGKGWLKGNKGTVTFDNYPVAQQVAERMGNAKVYFIDKSLEDLEQVLLEIEHRSTLSYKVKRLWLTFKNYFKLNNSI